MKNLTRVSILFKAFPKEIKPAGAGFLTSPMRAVSQVHQFSHTTQTLLIPFRNSFFFDTFSLSRLNSASPKIQNKIRVISSRSFSSAIEVEHPFDHEKATSSVKAVVTAKVTIGVVEDDSDLDDTSIFLELVSAELDHKTGLEKETIKANAYRMVDQDENGVKYECDFEVGEDFGEIGAVFVANEHNKEMHLKTIALEGLFNGNVNLNCNSWVASKDAANQEKRVFFTNKSYLPSQTPNGLRSLREKELEEIRGNGKGERIASDRIYDYDKYNDLGNPDKSDKLKRPVLGGKEHPYPRRCRTGRPQSTTDPMSETSSKSKNAYVPRDEAFSGVKNREFKGNTLFSLLHSVFPDLEATIVDKDLPFRDFKDIDSLFVDKADIPLPDNAGLRDFLPRVLEYISDAGEDLLRFETPAMIERDAFAWFRDVEFARQTLAGLNPYSIQLVTELPKSKLDPNIYGSPESAITKEIIESEIKGTLEEALEQKKLFMLDYHDLLLPFVKKVREIEGTTLYGSRTLFILTSNGILKPVAIELTRPQIDGKPQWKQVFTPTCDATERWLWRLAKTHVLAHDSGYHQLVSHWIRTHCATEPYIIATNRQLSVIHPVYKLLHPHFRYTMAINAVARVALINADGVIETAFSPAKYSMELSSAAYEIQWRFDHEALPADLITRGMAVEDPTAPHGLKLTIEDYPFANDGLILWDAIKQWVTDYVQHYYPKSALVESDKELEAWWTEIKTVGHADKTDEPWWPKLKTTEDLIGILTIMIWVASGHHAAVNFGQYTYAGYFPNRPTIARTNMPTEDPTNEEIVLFEEKPETTLLQCLPSQIQATKIIAALHVLSSHSSDEEYIGKEIEGAWEENPKIKAAFKRFQGKLQELETTIEDRNANAKLKNRRGAGVLPYELLKPVSEAGVTAKGVPNSISI